MRSGRQWLFQVDNSTAVLLHIYLGNSLEKDYQSRVSEFVGFNVLINTL